MGCFTAVAGHGRPGREATEKEPRVALIEIDRNRCKGCELCVGACPQHVLALTKELNARGNFFAKVANQGRCIGCRLCCITCPDAAIEMRVHGTLYEYFAY
jgi:2-oxoglutarate ferredoxin oxidoreductase subunit delta